MPKKHVLSAAMALHATSATQPQPQASAGMQSQHGLTAGMQSQAQNAGQVQIQAQQSTPESAAELMPPPSQRSTAIPQHTAAVAPDHAGSASQQSAGAANLQAPHVHQHQADISSHRPGSAQPPLGPESGSDSDDQKARKKKHKRERDSKHKRRKDKHSKRHKAEKQQGMSLRLVSVTHCRFINQQSIVFAWCCTQSCALRSITFSLLGTATLSGPAFLIMIHVHSTSSVYVTLCCACLQAIPRRSTGDVCSERHGV